MVLRSLSLAVVASLLVAGCTSGGGGGPEAGQVQEVGPDVLAPGEAPKSAAALAGKTGKDVPGDLVGQVRDDLNLSVAGASVAILGTQLRDRTNETGWFRLEGIDPGTHTLRIEADAYQVLEEKVTITAGLATVVHVLLLPDARGAGYRPHLHDYWGTDTQLTLMDDEFDPRDSADVGHPVLVQTYHTAQHPNTGSSVYIPIPPVDAGDARPTIVVPGTGSIEVKLTWDPVEVSVPAIGLTYRTAASTTLVALEAQPSPASWTIPVAANETDNGHQTFTLWEFYLVYANRPGTTTWRPSAVAGPIQVQILLNKDPSGVRFEPGHVDHWGDKTELELPVDPETLTFYSARTATVAAYHFIYLADGVIVPPGTTRMTLQFTWDDAGATIPVEKDLRLGWRTADQPPGQTRDPSMFYRDGEVTCGAKCWAFDVPVSTAQTDGYYQQASNWAFYPYLGYEEDQGRDRSLEGGIDMGLVVKVYRDPAA